MTLDLTCVVTRDGDVWLAECPELDIYSQGNGWTEANAERGNAREPRGSRLTIYPATRTNGVGTRCASTQAARPIGYMPEATRGAVNGEDGRDGLAVASYGTTSPATGSGTPVRLRARPPVTRPATSRRERRQTQADKACPRRDCGRDRSIYAETTMRHQHGTTSY